MDLSHPHLNPARAAWRRPLAQAALRLGAPAALLGVLWAPSLLHYRIDRTPLPAAALQAAHSAPADAVLDEVGHMALGLTLPPDVPVAAAAAGILRGQLDVPQFQPAPLALRGYPGDYHQGPPSLRLLVASLEAERLLLAAYEQTRDPALLQRAVERVRQFAQHEAAQRLADGFLWNDHAVGARVAVLARLWRHLRSQPALAAAAGDDVLGLVERSARLLAKPNQFTVRTNHGVVQNLALLQVTAAFPMLPETAAWRALALQRLKLQLGFYVSPEGMVLEHSPEYHHFGTELLAYAVRLQVLNGAQPDPALATAASRARTVLGQLLRPDGSLPAIGNTNIGRPFALPQAAPDGSVPVTMAAAPFAAPPPMAVLQPVAGYALWWQGSGDALSQTVLTWARHVGHGHKHADEGALQFWRGGQDWISNTGYWPYEAPNEAQAYGWAGSNAPHQPGEAAGVPRSVQLLGSGDGDGVRFADIRRSNGNGAQFRRQLLQLDDATLLVLDFSDASPGGYQSLWTVPPPLQLQADAGVARSYTSSTVHGQRLALSYSGAVQAALRKGSTQPFAGWVVADHRPTPAHALQLAASSPRATLALLLQVAPAGRAPGLLLLKEGAEGEHWEAEVQSAAGRWRITRDGKQLEVQAPDAARHLEVRAAPDVAAQQQALRDGYANAVSAFPPWRDLDYYRWRLSMLVAAMALAAELAWQAGRRWAGWGSPRRAALAHAGLLLAWASVSWWALRVYLV